MSQPIQFNRTTSPTSVPGLAAGEPAVCIAPGLTKLWIGDGTTNRLLLSSSPTDNSIFNLANYLPLVGGSLTGNLTIAMASAGPRLVLDASSGSSNWAQVWFNTNANGADFIQCEKAGSVRWTYELCSATAETGSNAGSDFVINRFDDTGTVIDQPLSIIRATGTTNLNGLQMNGPLNLQEDPAFPLEAATKNYVDNEINSVIDVTNVNSGRNFIDNPFFQIAQRGPGPFTTTGTTSLDRYALVANSGDTISVTQVSLTDADRAAIGDERAIEGLQAVFVGGATGTTVVIQRIENVYRLSGKTVTVSFYAKASSGTPAIGVGYQQTFGGGSANVVGNLGVTSPLTSSFQRYSFTVALPSAAGKTIGTASASVTAFQFYLSNGGNSASGGPIGAQSGTVELWGIQVEVNTSATALEPRDPETDLSRCQRYLCNVRAQDIVTLAAAGNFSVSVWFPVQQRNVPPGFTPNCQLTVNASTNAGSIALYGLGTNNSATVRFTALAAGDTTIDFNVLAQSDL